jgi:pyrroloquinoline quinone (PQQ) biosynthesis protein C
MNALAEKMSMPRLAEKDVHAKIGGKRFPCQNWPKKMSMPRLAEKYVHAKNWPKKMSMPRLA